MRIELTTRTLQVSVASLETCLPIKIFPRFTGCALAYQGLGKLESRAGSAPAHGIFAEFCLTNLANAT